MCESLKNSATFAHYQPLFRFQGPNSYLFVSPFGLKRLLPPPEAVFFMPSYDIQLSLFVSHTPTIVKVVENIIKYANYSNYYLSFVVLIVFYNENRI